MKKPAIILLVSILLLAGVSRAEDEDARDLRRLFRAEFAPDSALDIRQRAVEGVGASGRIEGVALLFHALDVTYDRLGELVETSREAQERLAKFEAPIFRDMARAERRARAKGGGLGYGIPESTRIRWSQLKRRVREAAVREAAELDLVDRIVRSFGRLLGTLDETIGHAVIVDYLGRLREIRDPARRADLVRALGFVGRSRAGEALVYLLVSDRDPRVQVAAALALGEAGSTRGVEVLIDRLHHPRWAIRATAAQALARLGEKAVEAVEPLVFMLEREPGRLREDAAAALEAITGRRLGPIPGRWRAWLNAKKRGEEYTGPEESTEDPAGATFYGIRTLSRRLLFVLDRSGSMRAAANPADRDRDRTKLALMKRELNQTVTTLDDDAVVNVVIYNHAFERFEARKSLVPLSPAVRRALERFLETFDAIGATNIHDALEEAFRMAGLGASDAPYETAFDTIFFLTDGNPTAGKILDPDHIRSEVRRWNALRRIRIHVIAVGPDVNEEFLRALAEEAGGQYVRR